jgi:hypothetical protein
MAVVTSLVIGASSLALGALGSIKQAEEAKRMRKNAEEAAALQYKQQQELMEIEREKQKKIEEDRANEAARIVGNQQRDAAQARAGVLKNRQGINTSSLGVTNSANTAGKTLLGT